MIEICALASGSNGNCYYIGNQHGAVLIDVGISTRQLMQRFSSAGLTPAKVKAIFVSHEHSDHSRGVQVLSKRLAIPVYMTSRTYYAMPRPHRPDYVQFFNPGEMVNTGSFVVHTLLKNHDAAEPCSFRIEYNGKSVGVFTDIGEPCSNVREAVHNCHALFMESNYDEEMLLKGSYPWFLKNRVASAQGHLSNIQALELIEHYGNPELECIFLSHISKENNTPDLALSVFQKLRDQMVIKPTSRFAATEVYMLNA
jgi:phosphoribosyl 1,2-cyclic phosphodiesterase